MRMVVLDIKVGEEKRKFYMDNYLHTQLTAKVQAGIKKKDKDWVLVVDGAEGTGKSVLAMQVAKVLDPSFCLDRVCMSPTEFTNAVVKAGKGQAVIFDEAFTGLSSRSSLSEVNRLLVSLMMEMRQKNLFVIIVMPTFFMLERYVALFRSSGLIHVYTKGGQRGRWVYFNRKKKKMLHFLGKQYYNYSQPKSRFVGRFYDQYVVSERAYRIKKGNALQEKSRTVDVGGGSVYFRQRNILFLVMCEVFGHSQSVVARECKKLGFQIEQHTISHNLAKCRAKLDSSDAVVPIEAPNQP